MICSILARLSMLCAHCFFHNLSSATFVKHFSKRSDWHKGALVLNAKCNPTTPFPLELQDPKVLLDDAWSVRVNSSLPAGNNSFWRRAASIFLSSCCIHLRLLSSAFQVTKDDTRLMLRELIHSPTFVYPGAFSLTMNLSDHYFFGRDPFFFESLHKNITESIMEGFKRLQSARDGSVFALFSHSQTRMALDSNQVLIEGSVSLIALNSTGPASYESWSNHAIDSFHAKALADEIQRLVSPATFMVCESCSVRLKFCLGLGLKTFLQHFFESDDFF